MTNRSGILFAVGATVAGLLTGVPSPAAADGVAPACRAAHLDRLRHQVVSDAAVLNRADPAQS